MEEHYSHFHETGSEGSTLPPWWALFPSLGSIDTKRTPCNEKQEGMVIIKKYEARDLYVQENETGTRRKGLAGVVISTMCEKV